MLCYLLDKFLKCIANLNKFQSFPGLVLEIIIDVASDSVLPLVDGYLNFTVETMIHGYHEYKSIRLNSAIEEELSCKREIGNAHDTHAVAVCNIIDGDIKTAGHVLHKKSAPCLIFIRLSGSILYIIKGNNRYSLDLPQYR